jgi:hypothetical protein
MNTLLNPQTGEVLTETPTCWVSTNGNLFLKTSTNEFKDDKCKPNPDFRGIIEYDYTSIYG